jgi:uncharacterized iron-regulated protein
MKMKLLITLFSLFLFLIVVLSIATVGSENVYQVSNGRIISFLKMISYVKNTDFIFVGEVHDSPENHRQELEIIRALHESNVPLSIGLEMFRSDSQKTLDEWVQGTLPLEAFLPIYYDNWHMAWPLYRDIFTYAREHSIPLVGLNIPDKIAAAVARNGFASLTEEERQQLPRGITCDVDPTYMEFIRKAYAGHNPKVNNQFQNFCEAQMVWDKSMAEHLIGYRKQHPLQTVVVLAGIGHAWKRGIPEQLARESRFTVKSVLPLVPGQIEKDRIAIEDTDYILLN